MMPYLSGVCVCVCGVCECVRMCVRVRVCVCVAHYNKTAHKSDVQGKGCSCVPEQAYQGHKPPRIGCLHNHRFDPVATEVLFNRDVQKHNHKNRASRRVPGSTVRMTGWSTSVRLQVVHMFVRAVHMTSWGTSVRLEVAALLRWCLQLQRIARI
jgi:hypothetical protein